MAQVKLTRKIETTVNSGGRETKMAHFTFEGYAGCCALYPDGTYFVQWATFSGSPNGLDFGDQIKALFN